MYEKIYQNTIRVSTYVSIMVVMLLTISASIAAQDIKTEQLENFGNGYFDGKDVIEVTPKAGMVTRQVVEMTAQRTLRVINYNKTPADVDLMAFDFKGKEIGRETLTVQSGGSLSVSLEKAFSNLQATDLNTVEIQTSVLSDKADPNTFAPDEGTANAYQLAVGFFSQRQSPWNSYQLGTCPSDTIGSSGCAITAIAMAMTPVVTNLDPGVLNTYLKNNGGYASGCLVIWANAAGIDGSGGFQYYGSSTVGSAANLKSLIDSGKFSVVKSTRFAPGSHYGTIIGYINNGTSLSDFYYLDPWDLTAQFRYIGDGFVSSSSAIQIYK